MSGMIVVVAVDGSAPSMRQDANDVARAGSG